MDFGAKAHYIYIYKYYNISTIILFVSISTFGMTFSDFRWGEISFFIGDTGGNALYRFEFDFKKRKTIQNNTFDAHKAPPAPS